MEYNGRKPKVTGTNRFQILNVIFRIGIILHKVPTSLCGTETKHQTFGEHLTSTVRTWPSHSFFLDVISNVTNSDKSKSLKGESLSTYLPNESGLLDAHHVLLSDVALSSSFPDASHFEGHSAEPNTSDKKDIFVFNGDGFKNETVVASLNFDDNQQPSSKFSSNRQYTNSGEAMNPTVPDDTSIFFKSKESSLATGKQSLEIMESKENNKDGTILTLMGREQYHHDANFRRGKNEDLLGIPWINGSLLLRRIQNIRPVSPAFQKLYALNSFRLPPSTAPPSIPLFIGFPPTETVIEVNEPEVTPPPNRYTDNISEINWGIPPMKVESTVAPEILTTSPATVTSRETFDDADWSKPGHGLHRPESIPTSIPHLRLPAVGEHVSGKLNTLAPTPPTTKGGASDLVFKIWEYTNEGLHLQSFKQIPATLLDGYNVSDGQVLNLEHIPLPIRKAVASVFNLTNSITKRQSGPGSYEAFHWQQLPSVVPLTTSAPPSILTPLPKPISLNYILWPSTTTSPPTVATPSPHFLSDSLAKLLLQASAFTTPTPAQVGSGIRIKESDILTNVASMALIMSKINKEIGHHEVTRKPSAPNLRLPESYDSQGNHGVSSEFWASLFPMYMNYLKHGQSAINRESLPGKKYGVSSLSHRDTGQAAFSSGSSNYHFYPRPRLPKPSPTIYDDSYKTAFVVKNVKKKLKSKKKKRSKQPTTYGIVDPGNVEFNYAFGTDILGMLKKIFYTVLALKAAPFIILTFLTVVPLILVVFHKILKGAKLADIIWKLLRPPKLGKIHHHYYPAQFKIHHRPYKTGWSPHYASWAPQYRGWSSYGGGWSSPGWSSYSGWPTPSSYSGWKSSHRYRRINREPFDDALVPSIDSLVQQTFGDSQGVNESSTKDEAFENSTTVVPFAIDATELDNVHNEKVMEILMNAKNITLQKLLESWELDFPSPSAILAERGHPVKKERKRKKRNLIEKRYIQRSTRVL